MVASILSALSELPALQKVNFRWRFTQTRREKGKSTRAARERRGVAAVVGESCCSLYLSLCLPRYVFVCHASAGSVNNFSRRVTASNAICVQGGGENRG